MARNREALVPKRESEAEVPGADAGFHLHFRPKLCLDHIYAFRVEGNFFSNLRCIAPLILREEMSFICWERTEIQFQRVYRFYLAVIMMFVALYRVFNGTELLSFDSPAKTDVVKRLLKMAKVLSPLRQGIEPKTSRMATELSCILYI